MPIKIPNLQKIAKEFSVKEFVYKDLHLDLKTQEVFEKTLQKKIRNNDIDVDYDHQAIKNSLQNLFNTRPGQRFLFPEYGLELEVFLFDIITQQNGQLIGEKLVQTVKLYEPRITVKACHVEAKPDDNEYDITLIVTVPIFNTSLSINTALNTKTQSFIFY